MRIFSFLLLLGTTLQALESPFPSTVEGLSVRNTHAIFGDMVLRSNAPTRMRDYDEFLDYGISRVLIFKNQTKDEVDKEIEIWKQEGLDEAKIHHIAFRWKDLLDFKQVCLQTVEGLRILHAARTQNEKIVFHCTVGEDRTGVLAGLYLLLSTERDLSDIFRDQMCENGYEAGNPEKPMKVVDVLRRELTPFFLKMAFLVEEGELKLSDLGEMACERDPSNLAQFKKHPKYAAKNYRCKKSSRYPKNQPKSDNIFRGKTRENGPDQGARSVS